MCGLRSKIFRQSVQIISTHTDVWVLIFGQSDETIFKQHTDVWVLIFGQSDETIFKQGVRRELCGVALITLDILPRMSIIVYMYAALRQ